jgi:hypothetical protein
MPLSLPLISIAAAPARLFIADVFADVNSFHTAIDAFHTLLIFFIFASTRALIIFAVLSVESAIISYFQIIDCHRHYDIADFHAFIDYAIADASSLPVFFALSPQAFSRRHASADRLSRLPLILACAAFS